MIRNVVTRFCSPLSYVLCRSSCNLAFLFFSNITVTVDEDIFPAWGTFLLFTSRDYRIASVVVAVVVLGCRSCRDEVTQLLYGGTPRVSFLDSLCGDRPGHLLGGDVEGAHLQLLHPLPLLLRWADVDLHHVSHEHVFCEGELRFTFLIDNDVVVGGGVGGVGVHHDLDVLCLGVGGLGLYPADHHYVVEEEEVEPLVYHRTCHPSRLRLRWRSRLRCGFLLSHLEE